MRGIIWQHQIISHMSANIFVRIEAQMYTPTWGWVYGSNDSYYLLTSQISL